MAYIGNNEVYFSMAVGEVDNVMSGDIQTDIDDDDAFPFYDMSSQSNKKTLWSNIKFKINTIITAITGTLSSLKTTNKASLVVAINELANADYITEQGTSGNWTYRKYKSGIVECWGIHQVNAAEDDNQTVPPQTIIDLPFAIYNRTETMVTIYAQAGWKVRKSYVNWALGTNEQIGIVAYAETGATDGTNIKASIHIKGTLNQ